MKFRLIAKKILTFVFILQAKLILAKYKPKIIVVTGSVGKTSAKSALYNVLRQFDSVRKNITKGNSYQIALTIIGASDKWFKSLIKGFFILIFKEKYPHYLILEIACRRPGELEEILPWLPIDFAIVTYFGMVPPHIEFFDSRKHLIEEKLKILQNLKKGGTVILNADSPDFNFIKEKIRAQIVTFGFDAGDVRGGNLQIIYESNLPTGINFRIDYGGNSVPVNIKGALGRAHVYAYLAALAFAYKNNFNMVLASQSAANYDAPWGRMKLLAGLKDSLIIDDSYNSSPSALEEAITALSEIKTTGRKVAVLGDMLELGRESHDVHIRLGELAGKTIDFLITVGSRARGISLGASVKLKSSQIMQFEKNDEVIEYLKNLIKPGDLILVKGSRAMRLEEVVKILSKAP